MPNCAVDPAHDAFALGLRDLVAADQFVEAPLNPGEAAIDRFLLAILKDHLAADLRGRLRDSAAHRSSSDDSDLLHD